jgi:hypothetical protein
MASSTLDELVEKLERATELAAGLIEPYLRPRVQEADYSEPVRDSGAFANAAPEGEMVSGENGLTDIEHEVSEHLCAAVTAFGKLEKRHPAEAREFVDGIHACQNQLAWRIVQRCFPKHWPVKHAE